jgi:hypothetical protein
MRKFILSIFAGFILAASSAYAQQPPGSHGAGTLTLTADTNIAAGTSASIDSSGGLAQTWGPTLGTPTAIWAPPYVAGNQGERFGPPTPTLILDATHFVSFMTVSPGAVGMPQGAAACSISGGAISCGAVDSSAPNIFNYGGDGMPPPFGQFYPAAALSASLYVALYQDGSSNPIVAACGISANVISCGTGVSVGSTGGPDEYNSQRVFGLSSTSFAVIYQDGSLNDWIVIGTVSGTAITLGTPAEFATSVNDLTAVKMDATHLVASYQIGAATDVIGFSVSGTTPTAGTPVAVTSGSGTSPWLTSLSATVFAWSGGQDQPAPVLVLTGSISGSSVTLGTGVEINTAFVLSIGATYISAVDATHFVALTDAPELCSESSLTTTCAPMQDTPAQDMAASPATSYSHVLSYSNVFGSIPAVLSSSSVLETDSFHNLFEYDGAVISPSLHQQAILWSNVYPLDSTHALDVYVDKNVGIDAVVITAHPQASAPVGFAPVACTAAQPCTIDLSGPVSGFSGLTAGENYYVNGDGTLTTTNTGHPAGIALSASMLLALPQPAMSVSP